MGPLRHPSDGVLRQLGDEPWLVPDRVHRHVASCPRCLSAQRAVGATASTVAGLLAGLGAPPVGNARSAVALERVTARIAAAGRSPIVTAGRALGLVDGVLQPRRRRRAGAVTLALLAGVAAVSTATAAGWVVIWRPSTVAPVPFEVGSLGLLRGLRDVGALRTAGHLSTRTVGSLAAGEAAAGVTLALPQRLPQGVAGPPSFQVTQPATTSFTFRASLARRWAAAAGIQLPPLPQGLDGTVFREETPAALVILYGGSGPTGIPTLAAAAMRAPVVRSTGADVAELERYLLSVPGLPASLRHAVEAFARPAQTLPIPVPVGVLSERTTSVDGVPAVALSDPSGLVTAVVWEAQGVLRALGGSLPAATTLALARAGG